MDRGTGNTRVRKGALREIEAKLHAHLGIPSPAGPGSTEETSRDLSDLMLDLQAEVAALHREAGRIGAIPENYPRRVTWVMRVISALLPWYTRPLVNFSRSAVSSLETTAHVLEQVMIRQEALAEEIRNLKSPRADSFER
jgi:hypothetical protein